MPIAKKQYTIKVQRYGYGGSARPPRFYTGTLDELVKTFSYDLEKGHSWNYSLSRTPKTITSLVSTLNRGNIASTTHYQDTYYELVENPPVEAPVTEPQVTEKSLSVDELSENISKIYEGLTRRSPRVQIIEGVIKKVSPSFKLTESRLSSTSIKEALKRCSPKILEALFNRVK